MRALVLTAPSRLELRDWPEPELAEDEVLVKVRACGICGSDIHGWDGSSGRRRPPLIMGHEASGEVVRTGPRVTRWAVADRVTFDSTLWCGACAYCAEGAVNLCERRQVVGVAPAEYRRHGAFAEYVAVPERVLYALPHGVGYEQGAMIEPIAVAVHAVRRVALPAGFSAVVVGAGMIGLLVVQVLRWAGAGRVVAVDLEERRRALALEMGATDAVDPRGEDVAAAVARLTHGRGADAAWEVVGATATIKSAVEAVRRGGQVVLVGNLAPTVELPLQTVVTRELRLHGTCGSAGEYPLCLDLLARGEVRVGPMMEAVVPLAEGAAWFERLSAPGGGRFMKVILQP